MSRMAFFHSDLIARRVAAALVLSLFCLLPHAASAQQGTPPAQRSYINPFPTGDRYRVLVIGDLLGDGLWSGLYRAFEEDANLEFVETCQGGDRRPALRQLRVSISTMLSRTATTRSLS